MKSLQIFSILLILFLVPACEEEDVHSPESLGSLYWKAMKEEKFAKVRPHLMNIRQINELIELSPSLGRYVEKGSTYSEKAYVQDELRVFKKAIRFLEEHHLAERDVNFQGSRYRQLFRERGVEVGQLTLTTDFRSQSLKIRFLMVFSHNRWRYLGLNGYRLKQTGLDNPEDNAVKI